YRPVFRHPSSRRPCPTASYTLSLHDALPISSVWNNLDIEIQIRTRLQHAWATAVETVDVMKGTDLKSGGGTPDWREFFALAASAIAIQEHQPPVPGTPSTLEEIRQSLKELNARLRALPLLRKYALTARMIAGSMGTDFMS